MKTQTFDVVVVGGGGEARRTNGMGWMGSESGLSRIRMLFEELHFHRGEGCEVLKAREGTQRTQDRHERVRVEQWHDGRNRRIGHDMKTDGK